MYPKSRKQAAQADQLESLDSTNTTLPLGRDPVLIRRDTEATTYEPTCFGEVITDFRNSPDFSLTGWVTLTSLSLNPSVMKWEQYNNNINLATV